MVFGIVQRKVRMMIEQHVLHLEIVLVIRSRPVASIAILESKTGA